MSSLLPIVLFFLLPMGVYFYNMYRARMDRGPKGVAGERVRAAKPAGMPRMRKAKFRVVGEERDCGRGMTHLFLSLTGSRESCSGCAALVRQSSPVDGDVVAEAERIIDEAQR